MLNATPPDRLQCYCVQFDVVGILSDAMYSDSHQVIDALAELIEATVQISDEKVMSLGRMSQVRHIILVDGPSFHAQFTPQQLKTIESNEMAIIVNELISAVGLQRYRFTERQNQGMSALVYPADFCSDFNLLTCGCRAVSS